MPFSVAEIRVGEPQREAVMTVFPLFSPDRDAVAYLFSDDALKSGAITISEISEGGSVPELVVDNHSDSRVLLIEGQELIGAKQNRILNASVLVAAQTKTRIPVSCVERGRWRYSSPIFGSGGTHSPSKLRHLLKQSVHRSVQAQQGHRSDQSAVWNEIQRKNLALSVSSDTDALHDTYHQHADRVVQMGRQFSCPPEATGIAVALEDRIVSIDLFDKPATCRKLWERIVAGVVLDAIEPRPIEQQAAAPDVLQFLDSLRPMTWEQTPAVGEGEEYRLGTETIQASALCFQSTPLHVSIVTGTSG